MRKAILPALCSIFLWNCNEGVPTPADPNPNPVYPKSAGSALAVTDKIFTDATGDVKIMIRTCDYPASATTGKHCTYCAVDQGWVMIGGGAEIEGSPSSARLRGSFPYTSDLVPPVTSPDGLDTDCTGNSPFNDINKDWIAWMARSNGASSHRLRAYVIGLQIAGLSEADLTGYRLINDNTTSAMTQPSLESAGFSGVIGGGANEVGSESCYLTESRPNNAGDGWRGSAYCSTPGALKVFSITLNPCPTVPGWDNCMDTKIRSALTASGTGYRTASLTTSYPWVTTAIGGKGVVNLASSRYLADLLPLVGGNQGASVTTKDQGVTVSGTTTAYTVSLFGGRWGAWRFNSIRLNSAGTALRRPSGAAPVTLMQTTAFPDGAPYRWNLESLGSGQYRVRNSNPSNPASGECAYRQSGTSTLRVGPCTSANEYKWTVIGDLRAGTFQLKNVSSGTCLSNDNTSSNSALTLTTCVNGYSSRQALFLDAFSWPQ